MRLLGFTKEKHSRARPTKIRYKIQSLGTDMLQELKGSNYTRYHIELIIGLVVVGFHRCRRYRNNLNDPPLSFPILRR